MKDDKKKLMVLGALVAVMLGVGAFSFLGGGSTPPPVVATDSKEKKDANAPKLDADGNPIVEGEEAEPPKNPLYAAALPQRDPFAETALAGEQVAPVLPSHPLPTPNTPAPRPYKRPRSSGGTNSYIPPVNPGISGPLPQTWGNGEGNVSISPSGPEPSSFGYSVAGTMTGGSRKIAVFTDSNGNQRMVPEGGSLDGDSKVVAIDKGSVTIEHRGKKQRLSLGGNPK